MKKQVEAITKKLIEHAQTYQAYRSMLDELMANGKTTGTNHSEAMMGYTTMNIQRMKRLDKRVKLQEKAVHTVKNIQKPMIWLSITEGWCGDAAQILPAIEQLAQLNPLVKHRLILRDEHLEVMEAFLTNGARSIPKIIFLDAETLEVLGDWGPKPAEMQKRLMEAKQSPDYQYNVFSVELHKWYAKNKTVNTQLEFAEALEQIEVLVS